MGDSRVLTQLKNALELPQIKDFVAKSLRVLFRNVHWHLDASNYAFHLGISAKKESNHSFD